MKTIISALVRWVVTIAGASWLGEVISQQDLNTVIAQAQVIVGAIVVIAPIIHSVIEKIQAMRSQKK